MRKSTRPVYWGRAVKTGHTEANLTGFVVEMDDIMVCIPEISQVIPPLFLLVFALVYLCYMGKEKTIRSWCGVSVLNVLQTIICFGLIIIHLILMAHLLPLDTLSKRSLAQYSIQILDFISLIAAFLLLRFDFAKGVLRSYVLPPYWMLLLIMKVFACDLYTFAAVPQENQLRYILYKVYLALLIAQVLLTFFVDKSKVSRKEKDEEDTYLLLNEYSERTTNMPKVVPGFYCNFWLFVTHLWLTLDIIYGFRHRITFDMLYRLHPRDECKALVEASKISMRNEDKRSPTNTIWRSLVRVLGPMLILVTILTLSASFLIFINPAILTLFISYVDSGDSDTSKGIYIAFLMMVCAMGATFGTQLYIFMSYYPAAKARSFLNSIVYQKMMRLSPSSRRRITIGQVVNLMSVDAQKVQDMFNFSTVSLSVPLMIVFAIYLLWEMVGASCFAGLAVLLILIPFNVMYLGRIGYNLQAQQMIYKDKRFRMLNEVLTGIKVLKLYAWESSFQDKILELRNKELTTIKHANYINAFSGVTWVLSPYLVSLAIFATYILSDPTHILTTTKIFVSVVLIYILNFPMSLLSVSVAAISQAFPSIRRIEEFLNLEELDSDKTRPNPRLVENSIEFEDAWFSWEEDLPPTIKEVTFNVPTGALVAVVGSVGSGKSTLILSVLGETKRMCGRLRLNGMFAYVPQQPWILHCSLKDNILFGKTLNPYNYEQVIDACALRQDLSLLPARDSTEIGERGINLSGGQKQRVSLARAVYQDEDIYLLDDPLSAVDAHVGKHIFDNVIGPNGMLKGKTRILSTHGLGFLPQCDMIVLLKNGSVIYCGNYEGFEEQLQIQDNTETDTLLLSDVSTGDTEDEPDNIGSSTVSRTRTLSISLADTLDVPEVSKLVEEEHEEVGDISLNVIKSYLKACGFVIVNCLAGSYILFIISQILTVIWLSKWADDKVVNGTYDRDQAFYRLSVYGYLGIAQVLSAAAAGASVAQGSYMASKVLHENLLKRILRAPMSFFDTTPLGRIMNRFSKDLDIVDFNMPMFIRQWLLVMSPVIVTLLVICYSTPLFVAVLLPLIMLYILFQRLFMRSVRQWKRIDSVRRSPIYMHIDESMNGAASIRAFCRGNQYIDKSDRLIDESQRPWFMIIFAYRWCCVTAEFIGAFIIFFAVLFATLERNVLSPGVAALSASYAVQMIMSLGASVRISSELDSYIVSLERVIEYTHIASEAPWEILEKTPPSTWPEFGAIQFKDYSTRYRPGLDLVLKDLNFNIRPGEMVGIIGRTGAGKSSLSLALFRIIESAIGRIIIDGLSTAEMGLHDLRSKISIIPQDPVVFSGSLRHNLDPFNHYSNEELWQALQHAHLEDFVSNDKVGLYYDCGENGGSLSIGQRQLLCLARALLRKSKILVLDEATAAVDFETDSLIQTTIREKFKHCTILTVAHRINTVLDYNKIMVLDNGRIIEMDEPGNLLSMKSSAFYSMAKKAGLI